MVGKKIAKLQHSEKFVKEIGTPKMRQPRMVTGDFEVSGRSSHPETYLTKSEVRLRLAKTDETLINRAFGASRRSQNAPDPGIRARLWSGRKERELMRALAPGLCPLPGRTNVSCRMRHSRGKAHFSFHTVYGPTSSPEKRVFNPLERFGDINAGLYKAAGKTQVFGH